MPYNFVADSFHTNKLCSRPSSSKVRFRWKTAVLRFSALLYGGLVATYDVHLRSTTRFPMSLSLRLIGKRVVDFLLVLILLGATAEALRANID